MPYVLPTFAGGTPQFAYYHAYGDSITYGLTLSDPETQRYASLTSQAKGLTLTDSAIASDQSCDIAPRQIFATKDNPTLSVAGLATLLIGVNDVGRRGIGAYETTFSLCQLAAAAWLAIPNEEKVLTGAPGIVAAGAFTTETAGNWNALTSGSAGAQLSVPFVLKQSGSVYVWYRITDGSPGTFTYAVDGSNQGTLTTAVTPAMATFNGTTSSLGVLRLQSVSAGNHTLTLQQTNAGSSGFGFVGLGLPDRTQTNLPAVFVGLLSKTMPACDFCLNYDGDIRATVALLAGDGLNVQTFDAGEYMSGTTSDLNDSVHPNVLGHLEIAHALLDALPSPATPAK